jgi:hypothetical protein
MTEVLLTVYCSKADAGLIASTLRDATRHPVHQRNEIVHGLDFSDASAAESVTGRLDRCAIDVRIGDEAASDLIARIGALKRAAPVRWRLTPVIASGRLT